MGAALGIAERLLALETAVAELRGVVGGAATSAAPSQAGEAEALAGPSASGGGDEKARQVTRKKVG